MKVKLVNHQNCDLIIFLNQLQCATQLFCLNKTESLTQQHLRIWSAIILNTIVMELLEHLSPRLDFKSSLGSRVLI